MSQAENGVVDECLWALIHHGFFTFPRVFPRGIKVEWPDIDTNRYIGVAWKSNTGAMKFGKSFVRFGIPGLPDITGWHFPTGKRLSIEVKTGTGSMNPNQVKHLKLSKETGCLAGVARSYVDVENLLKEWGIKRCASR